MVEKMTLNLYFNAKITAEPPMTMGSEAKFHQPIAHPRDKLEGIRSKTEVLIEAIISIAPLDFQTCVFNIETESDDDFQLISRIISSEFSYCNTRITNRRPSTINDWINDLTDHADIFGDKVPIVVVMNHDHIFIDDNRHHFIESVQNAFEKESGNVIFFYSHAPELVSWIINGQEGRAKQISSRLWRINKFKIPHSISVMRLPTLRYIFEKIHFKGDYIGRIDWPEVDYSLVRISALISPREFFRHYDGYSHISALSEYKPETAGSQSKSDTISNLDEICDKYYHIWKYMSLLAVRDSFRCGADYKSNKHKFLRSIENTFGIFEDNYLKVDFSNKDEIYFKIKEGVRNRIYFNLLDTYMRVRADFELGIGRTSGSWKGFIMRIIKNFKRLVSRKRFN